MNGIITCITMKALSCPRVFIKQEVKIIPSIEGSSNFARGIWNLSLSEAYFFQEKKKQQRNQREGSKLIIV